MGPQRHKGLDHQRWHGRYPRRRRGRSRARPKGHASFIVPPGTAGLTQGQKYKKHGIKASHTAEVVLDDVRVPGHCLLGGKEKLDERLPTASGWSGNAQAAMQPSRRPDRPSARALGIARAATSTQPNSKGTTLGRPIIKNQGIAFMLADMATSGGHPRPHLEGGVLGKQRAFKNAEGSMAKMKAGRVATWTTSGRSRSSAAMATPVSTRLSAGTATPRSTTSSRAPSRSSSW